jgi:hypothetical protein
MRPDWPLLSTRPAGPQQIGNSVPHARFDGHVPGGLAERARVRYAQLQYVVQGHPRSSAFSNSEDIGHARENAQKDTREERVISPSADNRLGIVTLVTAAPASPTISSAPAVDDHRVSRAVQEGGAASKLAKLFVSQSWIRHGGQTWTTLFRNSI